MAQELLMPQSVRQLAIITGYGLTKSLSHMGDEEGQYWVTFKIGNSESKCEVWAPISYGHPHEKIKGVLGLPASKDIVGMFRLCLLELADNPNDDLAKRTARYVAGLECEQFPSIVGCERSESDASNPTKPPKFSHATPAEMLGYIKACLPN